MGTIIVKRVPIINMQMTILFNIGETDKKPIRLSFYRRYTLPDHDFEHLNLQLFRIVLDDGSSFMINLWICAKTSTSVLLI
ncbi:hypothetical protein SAMN05216327_12073 [Dyadobacter sp. SG02]|nr:hypothetical protein SAMN05216327_12073 [Dyadobacter sp. SG02]